eukprot:11188644-Lingulodinium_polyedra.AAC.1
MARARRVRPALAATIAGPSDGAKLHHPVGGPCEEPHVELRVERGCVYAGTAAPPGGPVRM